MADGIRRPGDYKLHNLDLYATEDYAGPPVSLTDIFLEFHVFEDSQKSFMYGHVTIQDSIGLYSKLPILGEETIYIKFETPGTDKLIELEASVYRVSDRQRIANNSQYYVLHFVSKEFITGLQTPVSRSYKDLLPNEIVEEFYDEYVKYEDYQLIQEKPIEIEEMTEKQWVVFPTWTPEKCLNYLASKSVSEEYYEGEPVVFFEDRRGFHFRTMRQLIWDEDVSPTGGAKEEIYYSNQPSGPGTIDEGAQGALRISQFRVVSSTDTVERMVNGYYKNKTINVDWERHLILEKDYHIIQDYELNQRISKPQYAFGTETFMNNIKRDAHVRLISSRWGQRDDGGIAGLTDETYDFDRFEHISKRVHREFKGITVEATVPGNTVRKLFDVIKVKIYEPDATAQNQLDKYLSGDYYINAIHHICTPAAYEHTLEIVKDTLEQPLGRE